MKERRYGSFMQHWSGPVQVGIEATGFDVLVSGTDGLSWGSTAGWVIHRKFARRRRAKQKHDRGDAALLLKATNRKPLSLDLDALHCTA